MQTQVGLGFAWLLLDGKQKELVKAAWSRHPMGRYLLPFEIGRILKTEIKKTVKDTEADSMTRTWIDFCREANIGQDSNPSDCREWFAWLDYAVKNYQEPLPVASGTDWHGN